jgi:ribosome-binding protein aMBF1 (putative translation factor)
MPDPKPYRFVDLAEKLRMPVEDLMRQCNGHASPSKALVKGLARELDINESYLEKLAEEVRKDWGSARRGEAWADSESTSNLRFAGKIR